jgi:hypothetical protein
MDTVQTESIGTIAQVIQDFISDIPSSSESLSADPLARCNSLRKRAAYKAALVSGSLSLPPGPFGMLTIIPDLLAVWKIQAQLVADIAAAFGKTATLTREQMLYCLFRHLASHVVRDLAVRVGEKILVRRASLRLLQQLLKKIGVIVTQRIAGRFVARWIPVLGALGVGAYAFYDTTQVGDTAIELFQQNETE